MAYYCISHVIVRYTRFGQADKKEADKKPTHGTNSVAEADLWPMGIVMILDTDSTLGKHVLVGGKDDGFTVARPTNEVIHR